MTDRHALIAINRVAGFGAARARLLEEAFGSFAEVRNASANAVCQACKGISPQQAAQLIEVLHSDFAEREEERAEKASTTILTWVDEGYPEALRNASAQLPPLALYCVGDVALLRQTSVAIVGSRRASVYGAEQAQRFAFRLAQAGIHVVSGLAEGIDSAAHEGAVMAKGCRGKTIACVGAALDQVYPASRVPLAREIVRSGGLVVSEYPFGRHADAQTFPQRNRLIASLGKATLVIESPLRSGTLITVDYAHAYHRQAYVLPGRADQPSFAGNHKLLREDGGRLVTAPEQILDDFGELELREGYTLAEKPAVPLGLSAEEERVYTALGAEALSLDELAQRTGMDMPTVMSTAIALQMRKRLAALPGGLVKRVER